jgi:hypothetical protein
MVSFVPVLIYCCLFKNDDDFYDRTYQNCTVEELFTQQTMEM